MMGSPELDQDTLDCQVVDQKSILGVLVDSQLTFAPLLLQTISKAWNLFEAMYHTAEAASFSAPVVAAQVITRIHPVVLFPAPFLAVAPSVLRKLDFLQWRMAKTILGCRYQKGLRHHVAVAQCGWNLRLGTCLLLEVAMYQARMHFLPAEHPTVVLSSLIETLPCVSWFSKVCDLFQQADLHESVPAIRSCGLFTGDQIELARREPRLRKKLLSRYRREILLPLFLEHDRRQLYQHLNEPMQGLGGVTLGQLQFQSMAWVWEDLGIDLSDVDITWFNFRASIVRVTGRWPLPLDDSCQGCLTVRLALQVQSQSAMCFALA